MWPFKKPKKVQVSKMAIRKAVAGDRASIAQCINQNFARIDSQYPDALDRNTSRAWTAQTVAGMVQYADSSWVAVNDVSGKIEGVLMAGLENHRLENGTLEKWYVIKILASANNVDNITNWHKKIMYRLLKVALPDAKTRLGCVGGATELPTGIQDLYNEVSTFSLFQSRQTGNGTRIAWVRFSTDLAELNAKES